MARGLRFLGRLNGVEIKEVPWLPYTNKEGTQVHWVPVPRQTGLGFCVSRTIYNNLMITTTPLREEFDW